jgi:hypothetical protein
MEKVEKTKTLIASEPRYRLVIYKMLKFCEAPRSTSEVEQEALSFPEMKTAIHSPGILLGWLAEAGGVERVAVPARGSTLPAPPETPGEGEEETQEKWQTTEAGKQVAEMEAPQKRLLELIAQEPAYSEIYRQVIGFCQTPRQRAEIEKLLQGNPVMEKPKVYPTFFIQGLEEAGGLEWVDNRWRTTQVGKGVLG